MSGLGKFGRIIYMGVVDKMLVGCFRKGLWPIGDNIKVLLESFSCTSIGGNGGVSSGQISASSVAICVVGF